MIIIIFTTIQFEYLKDLGQSLIQSAQILTAYG